MFVNDVSSQESLKRFNNKDAPTIITSDLLDLDTKKREFVYTGNVIVIQDDLKITCEKLLGIYDANNEIKSLTALTNVVITKGVDIRALSQRADYDPKADMIKLTENPSLQRGGSELRSEIIKIFISTEKTVAEGRVQMKVLEGASSAKAISQ